jgi:hypothetical protein
MPLLAQAYFVANDASQMSWRTFFPATESLPTVTLPLHGGPPDWLSGMRPGTPACQGKDGSVVPVQSSQLAVSAYEGCEKSKFAAHVSKPAAAAGPGAAGQESPASGVTRTPLLELEEDAVTPSPPPLEDALGVPPPLEDALGAPPPLLELEEGDTVDPPAPELCFALEQALAAPTRAIVRHAK